MSQLLEIGKGFSWDEAREHNLKMVKILEQTLTETNLSDEERLLINERLSFFKSTESFIKFHEERKKFAG